MYSYGRNINEVSYRHSRANNRPRLCTVKSRFAYRLNYIVMGSGCTTIYWDQFDTKLLASFSKNVSILICILGHLGNNIQTSK